MIRLHGPISRTDIAQEIGLSQAAVSEITAALIEQGIIYEDKAGESRGGRRPILLALNKQAGLIVGVKLREESITAAITDMAAAIIEQVDVPLGDDRSPAAVIETLAQMVEALRARHRHQQIFGIGLGMAGVIDRREGICRFSPFLNWRDVPLRQMLEQRLQLPVVIENDANTLAMAESWFGAGQGVDDFLVITLGRGIGLGMLLGGQLYRGGSGGGGEFGHLTMVAEGPLCDCGKRGCLEALVSEPAILRRMRDLAGREMTMDEAVDLARHGDLAANGVFTAAGRTLGLAISYLVNVFNPPLLIVGGEGARALDLLLEPLQQTLAVNCFNGFYADLRLVAEPWGDDAWAQGAAGLMLEELFRPTLYHDDDARVSLSARTSAP